MKKMKANGQPTKRRTLMSKRAIRCREEIKACIKNWESKNPQSPEVVASTNNYIEDLRKYEGFYFRAGGCHCIAGGIGRVNRSQSKEMIVATEIATCRYNEKNNTDLKPVKLLRANWSFSSMPYCYITFELSDGKFYEAWVRLNNGRFPGKKSVVKVMREARHYPAQTEPYTYHQF